MPSPRCDSSTTSALIFAAGRSCSIVGEACSLRRVMTTALVVGAKSASDEAVSKTLAQVRPWSLMLVIANPDDYIDDMLVALQA